MNISALYYDYYDKSGEQNNHINKFVAAGLLYIIGNYISSYSSYFVLTMCCRNNHTCNFYNDMFNKMFAEWNEWPLQIVIIHNNHYRKVPGAQHYNMIFTDSYEAFSETEIHTYTAEYNNNDYYFIFLQAYDHLLPGEMQKIFEYCWQHYLINCIIQVQNAKGRVLLYTYYPFTEKHCGKVEVVLVNEYNGTSLIHKELFSKKLKNLYGCPLRAALWHVPPYVYLSTDANNVTYVSGGFEGKLLLELSKKLNFSLDVIIPVNNSQRGTVLQNGSLTGALKLLHERQADLSLGSFRQTKQRNLLLTSSLSYYQSVWAVTILNDAYILNSLETILFPFSTGTWYLLAFVCIFALVGVALLRRFFCNFELKHMDRVTLDLLLILIGMPAQCRSVVTVTRILSVTWMMFSLILRTVYHARLFHLIQSHITRHMPQSLEELVDTNYLLIVNPATFEAMQSIALFNTTNFIILHKNVDEEPLKYLENMPVKQARHAAVALPSVFIHYYIQTHKKTDVFKLLPQSIMNVKLCMYYSKHSFISNQFDETIRMINGFGIFEAWFGLEIDVNYIRNTNIKANKIIGFEELQMVFILLLVGYMMAIVAFVIELVYSRINRRKCLATFSRIVNWFKRFRSVKKF